MPLLTLEDFARSLDEVIATDDEVIVIYSGIWTFGARLKLDRALLPQRLNDVITSVCGAHRTVLQATYTYSFTKTHRFDPVSSLPETGVLPTQWLRRYGVTRTKSAMNSFGGTGPIVSRLANLRARTLWGEGSVKEYMEKINARIVMLGLPWELACAYLHRMEEVAQVPYRYYKYFHGSWVENGLESPWAETMYVRPLACPVVYRWRMITDELLRMGRVVLGSRSFHLESALAKDIANVGLAFLTRDPYALLVNSDEVKRWVKYSKDQEVAALGHLGNSARP